ncbi:MAG: BTAD domain-containing putative transcriptional regulator [Paracoccaceae bacterium]
MSSLRQLIRKLRIAAPELEETISFGRKNISVEKGAVSVDLDVFKQRLSANDPRVLSETFDFGIEDIFTRFVGISGYLDSWIAIMRNQIDSSLCTFLSRSLDFSDWSADFREFAARTLLHFDPTNEVACEYLMRSFAQNGDQATAIQLYNVLYETLGDVHDTEPSLQIQHLVANIKMGEIEKPSAQVASPDHSSSLDLPAIFVAPFESDITGGRSRDFAHIFRQELIVSLSTFREWSLYDTKPAVSNGFRLEGDARGIGGELTLTATLKVAETNRIVWSDRYYIDHQNWGKVQRQMARRLSLAMNTGLSHDRLNQRPIRDFSNAPFFDRWIMAQSLLLEWGPSELQRASDLLDKVLEDAHDFSPAHASRSNIEIMRSLVAPGALRTQDSLSLSVFHAKQALVFDPLDPRAHVAMGWAFAMNGQHSSSLFHFETCRELSPCSTLCSLSYALGFAFAGDTKNACRVVDEVLALVETVPPYLWGYIQNIRFLDGNLEGAVRAGQRAGNSIANLPAWQVAALWEVGDKESAIQVAEEFVEHSRAHWVGAGPFSQQALVNWFISCFPIRDQKQILRLRSELESVLSKAVGRMDNASPLA